MRPATMTTRNVAAACENNAAGVTTVAPRVVGGDLREDAAHRGGGGVLAARSQSLWARPGVIDRWWHSHRGRPR